MIDATFFATTSRPFYEVLQSAITKGLTSRIRNIKTDTKYLTKPTP